MRRCLLAVLAHPDDETFGCGGLLARYASEGVRVALICATSGEAGEISDPSPATRETIGDVRERELRAACDVLGVEDLFVLGYRDSGMAGSPDNDHPRSFCRASRHEVVEKITEVVREVRPQVMLTFDPQGGYGHPDHIASHHAAVEAFRASEPHRLDKLYYITIPRSITRAFQEAIREADFESDFSDLDPKPMGTPDEEITTEVDVAAYSGHKERAARCHRTQVDGDDPFGWLPDGIRTRWLSTEYLVRAEPPFSAGRDDIERDVFDGIPA